MANKVRLIGDKAMNKVVAPLDNVQAAVESTGHAIGAKAEQRLAGHRDSGAHQIEVEKNLDVKYGSLDMEISLVGPAPLSVEFGHIHNFTGEYVEGLYIVTGAAGLLD